MKMLYKKFVEQNKVNYDSFKDWYCSSLVMVHLRYVLIFLNK